MPSNRNFAYTFSFVFLIVALVFLYLESHNYIILFLFLSFTFLLAGKVKPAFFKYLNYVWYKFAILLNYTISPVIVFLLFYFVVTPFGLVARLFSKDLKIIKGYQTNDSSNFVDSEDQVNYSNQF